MKIFGDHSNSFHTYEKEPGMLWGSNDVLVGDEKDCRIIRPSIFGPTTVEDKKIKPKIYLHIFNSPWSFLTGILRKYILSYKWQTVYLDQENGKRPQEVLVYNGWFWDPQRFSLQVSRVFNQSLFALTLGPNKYTEAAGIECFKIPRSYKPNQVIVGSRNNYFIAMGTLEDLYPIYRVRNLFSSLKYQFLKKNSVNWQEVTVKVGTIAENVLIQKADHDVLKKAGLIEELKPAVATK